MDRKIDKGLKAALIQLCKESSDGPYFWKKYYDWCIKSYRVSREKRYSISELARTLKQQQVKNAKDLIVAYFHILYSLAIFEGVEIFGEGFNI